jgi:nucleoside-diphosphate-sugar epimerase
MISTAEPKRVFITGATGLIGSHIARQYLSAGYQVSALKRPASSYGLLTDVAARIDWCEGDVLDIPSLEAAIQPGVDVIHAAGCVSFLNRDNARMERTNVEGTTNLVNVCLKVGIRKFGYVSSAKALGRPTHRQESAPENQFEPILIDENQKWEESPRNSPYAKTKYRAELEVWRAIAEGLTTVIINPVMTLGVGNWKHSSLRIVDYVAKEKRYYAGGLINIVDVLDVAEVMVRLMESNITARRFILCGGTIPYKSLFDQLAVAMHKRAPDVRVARWVTALIWPLEVIRAWLFRTTPLITHETARAASLLHIYDGRRIRQELGFQYRSLEQTIRRVGEGFRTGDKGR